MEISAGEHLEAQRRRLGIDLRDVWVGYFGLGGMNTPADIEAYLRGSASFTRVEHDILAQAINEHALDRGMDHPAPYAEQAAGPTASPSS